MASFLFSNSPYYNYRNYYSRYNNYYKNLQKSRDSMKSNEKKVVENKPNSEENVQVLVDQKTHKNRSSKYNFTGPVRFNFDSLNNSEEPIIELMGLKLYLDDLIIIGILFFLYQEDVKDDLLFISLILLLLS